MNGRYLIPANTKNGSLIFGIFRKVDLIIASVGVGVSLLLMLILPLTSTFVTVMALSPGFICAFLVFPVPYYHNMLVVLTELFEFLTSRQKYIWKGWCAISDEKKRKH
ncbi:MAG: hypothetical protein J6B89_01600 [Bacilli bacterium]|nr:hypothetical protein [Bacilli bacterium]